MFVLKHIYFYAPLVRVARFFSISDTLHGTLATVGICPSVVTLLPAVLA
jgi:hypothetical protein